MKIQSPPPPSVTLALSSVTVSNSVPLISILALVTDGTIVKFAFVSSIYCKVRLYSCPAWTLG